MASFYATAEGVSYTKPEYLSEKVTSSSSATSSISYDEAFKIAQNVANSVAKNDSNIIDQTLNISTKLFSSINVFQLIGADENIYITKHNGNIISMYSDYTFNWACNLNKTVSSYPIFDSNGNLNVVTSDCFLYVINKYNGSFMKIVNLNKINI